jgi:hypothetical protein
MTFFFIVDSLWEYHGKGDTISHSRMRPIFIPRQNPLPMIHAARFMAFPVAPGRNSAEPLAALIAEDGVEKVVKGAFRTGPGFGFRFHGMAALDAE